MNASSNHYKSTDQELTEEQRSVLPKIQKLLNLAANNTNAEEAAAAASRAQDLLLAYNLSSDMLDTDFEGGQRGREQMKGGSREYERQLWGWVAELNFCAHWVGQRYTIHHRKKAPQPGSRWYGVPEDQVPDYVLYHKQHSWHHFLIGRKANVAATIAMARYLQKRVDDLAMEFIHHDNGARYGKRAMSFRDGATHQIVMKLIERREAILSEETKARAEAERRAAEARMRGESVETALTIATHKQNEDDLNEDFRRGVDPGTTARERAERAAKRRAAEEEYTRWAAENPEEARKREAERLAQQEKEAKRRASRGGRTPDFKGDTQAWLSGSAKGKDISIDPQAEAAKPKAYL